MAAPTVIQEAFDEKLNGAAATATFTAAPTSGGGRYLIAVGHSLSVDAAAQWGSAGFTAFPDTLALDSGRPTQFAYRKIQAGDPSAYSIAWEVADPIVETEISIAHIWEVSGLDDSALLFDTSIGVAGTFTSIQAGAVDVPEGGGVVFVAAGLGGPGGTALATPINQSFVHNAAGYTAHTRMICGYKTFAAATTGVNPTMSWTDARRANAVAISLKSAAPVVAGTSYKAKVYDGSVWKNHELKRLP